MYMHYLYALSHVRGHIRAVRVVSEVYVVRVVPVVRILCMHVCTCVRVWVGACQCGYALECARARTYVGGCGWGVNRVWVSGLGCK